MNSTATCPGFRGEWQVMQSPIRQRLVDIMNLGWKTRLRAAEGVLRRLARFASSGRAPGGILLAAGLTLAGTGCERRKAPVAAVRSLGAEAAVYTNHQVARVPWSINVVGWPRTDATYRLVSTHAGQGVLGLGTLSEQIEALNPALGRPLAGVNGDFYQRDRAYAGDPRGLQIIDGELISAPTGGAAFWIDAAGQPHTGPVVPEFHVTWPNGKRTPIGLNEPRPSQRAVLYTPAIGDSTRTERGRELILELPPTTAGTWQKPRLGESFEAQVKSVRSSGDSPVEPGTVVLSLGPALAATTPVPEPGTTLRIHLGSSPDLRGATTAIGGGPILLRRGEMVELRDDRDEYRFSSRFERHPRSALGWGPNRAFFVQVDGRQHGVSAGMTLRELARYLQDLGCEEAINFDGGGSSSLWFDGEIRSRPCDGFERDIANALVLVRDPSAAARTASSEAANAESAVTYHQDSIREVPWSVHLAKIDRSQPGVGFYTTLGGGATLGANTVSDQIKTIPPEAGLPLAAVNGDYYEKGDVYPMRPRDLQIRFGEVISRPSGHACFWIEADGTPRITNVHSAFRVTWPNGSSSELGLNEERKDDAAVLFTHVIGETTQARGGMELILEPAQGANPAWGPLRIGMTYEARVRAVSLEGNSPTTPQSLVLSIGPALAPKLPAFVPGRSTIRFTTATLPALSNVDFAIGGGPTLVRDGKPMEWTGSLQTRHPRTAVGWNKTHYFLAVVDGRQASVSVGMTFPEFARYLAKAGCEFALNLDGGGSTTLWALGELRNSPSEGEERPAVNALVAVRKPTPAAPSPPP